MYKFLIRPFLFLFSPETSHHLIIFFLKIPGVNILLRLLYDYKNPKLERKVFGLIFPNPIGLAAGFDKDAKFFNEIANCGFGFIEIGTVTPRLQPGNEKPRLFRLPKDEALINRMGFNNDGVDAVVNRLKKRKNFRIIIGANIGKNKTTLNENALADYEYCFEKLFNYADYFVVNVSSPNTPGLRDLQDKEPLKKILFRLMYINEMRGKKPLLLKIAPDLTNDQLDGIIEIVQEAKIDGIVATNTTVLRENLQTSDSEVKAIGAGGLSGKPLAQRSTEIIKYLYNKSKGTIPIIASGGIHSVQDAIDKLNAGASLIQLYTGLVYEGPDLVRRINKALLK